MSPVVYELNQRSHYDTTQSIARFLIVLPEVREIMQDGRFITVYYRGGDKTRFEFDGSYSEAEAEGKKVLVELKNKITEYYTTR